MPNIEHSAITDPDIHEPKGATTADAGQIYVADGANSGAWSYLPFGWGYYQDDSAAQTFNTTAAKVTINASGTDTEESYLPRAIRGSDNLWDTATNKIDPIALGDA